MISESLYRKLTGFVHARHRNGGQELILNEIIASLAGLHTICLPFGTRSDTLAIMLDRSGFAVTWHTPATGPLGLYPHADGLYFGTPTVVDGKELFDTGRRWTCEKDREWVRKAVAEARRLGYKRIVSGLGSGDVLPEEREKDLDGAELVCLKHFGDFADWVHVKELR